MLARIRPIVRGALVLGLLGFTALSFMQASGQYGATAPVALASPQIDGDSINNDNLDLNLNSSQEHLLNDDPHDLNHQEKRDLHQARHEVKRAISEQRRENGNDNS